MLDGKLTHRVKVDESMWNVDREACILCINLEKCKELMWKSVLEGEKEIDITKVCPAFYNTHKQRALYCKKHTSGVHKALESMLPVSNLKLKSSL